MNSSIRGTSKIGNVLGPVGTGKKTEGLDLDLRDCRVDSSTTRIGP